MFYWICPECGGEIPPAAKACPVCEPSNEAAGAPVSGSPASAAAVAVAKESIAVPAPSIATAVETQQEIPSTVEILSRVKEIPATPVVLKEPVQERLEPFIAAAPPAATSAASNVAEAPPAAPAEAERLPAAAPQRTSTQEIGTQETGPQETGAQETGAQETGAQEIATQETVPESEAQHAAQIPESETPALENEIQVAVTAEPPMEAPPRETSAELETEAQQPAPIAVEPAAYASELIRASARIAPEPIAPEAIARESLAPELIAPEVINEEPVSVETVSAESTNATLVNAGPVSPTSAGQEPISDDPLFALAEQIRATQVRHDAAQAAIFEPASQSSPVFSETPMADLAASVKEAVPTAEAASTVEAAAVARENKPESPTLEPEAEREPEPVAAAARPEPSQVAPPSPLSGLARLVSAVGVVELVSSAGVVERVSSPGVVDAHKPLSPEPAVRELTSPNVVSAESRSTDATFHEVASHPDVHEGIIATDLQTAAEQLALSLSLVSREASLQESTSQRVNAAVGLLEPPATEPPARLLLPPPVRETIAPPPAALVEAPPAPEATGVVASGISSLADAPPSGSRLALAPLQSYKSAAGRAMHPAVPSSKILAQESTPKITLPGPALPPQLVSLQSAGVITRLGNDALPKKRGGAPGWLVSFLVMLALLLLGTVLFNSSPVQHSKADAKSVPVETPAPVVVQSASHPLSHYIEVTGFRIVVDLNKKSEIHYLVVNHSSAALSDLTVYVTLRSTGAKPGQPPVSRFSFRTPDLAPFESKEMTSPIEKVTRPVAVPDWAELRADVQVTQ